MIRFWWLTTLVCLYGYTKAEVYVATECYGNALSLSCEANHRIKVLDDFFGVTSTSGTDDPCSYHPGDCTVTNNRYTSLVHRFCEGKRTCTNFQVDRRYCGINHTNYEQVEYQCIPETKINDMCTPKTFTNWNGYLATPNFPNEYPPSQHCVCTMWTAPQNVRIKLEATHFVVKFDNPCKDWIEIDSGNKKRKICGAYRSTIISDFFQLTFHSDSIQGHQGAWLYFSAYPDERNVSIHVACRPEKYTLNQKPEKIKTLPTPSVTSNYADDDAVNVDDVDAKTKHENNIEDIDKSSTISTTTLQDSVLKTEVKQTTVLTTILPRPITTTNAVVDMISHKEGVILNSDNNIVLTTADNGEKQISSSRDRNLKHMLEHNKIKIIDTETNPVFITNKSNRNQKPNSYQDLSNFRLNEDDWTQGGYPYENRHKNKTINRNPYGIQGASFIVESVKQPDHVNSNQDVFETGKIGKAPHSGLDLYQSPFQGKHITGIIIISICVGGIVVLVIVLGVMLCVNKSKKPKRSLRRQRRRNERIQQRLNTLSFYDSIPMYDSIGRTGGVARAPINTPAPPLNTSEDQDDTVNISTDLDVTIKSLPLNYKQARGKQRAISTISDRVGPFWAQTLDGQPQQPKESESLCNIGNNNSIDTDNSMYIDSSLYASLNRSYSSVIDTRDADDGGDISNIDSLEPNTSDDAISEQVTQLTGEQSPNSMSPAVNLSYDCAEEDICTHV